MKGIYAQWNNAGNWSGGIPTSKNDASIVGNYTLNVDAPANPRRITFGGSGSDRVTLNVNSLLRYFDPNGAEEWGISGDTIVININNGGTLSGDGNAIGASASRIDGYVAIKVNRGGTLSHIARLGSGQGNDVDIILNGGTFTNLAGNSTGATFGNFRLREGSITGTGTLDLGVSGSGRALTIAGFPEGFLDLRKVTIRIAVLSGYEPKAGDVFDFFSGVFAEGSTIGDGSNISAISADGLWEFTYDLSEWNKESALNKGVVTLTSAVDIPEARHATLLLVMGVAGMLFLRRR